MGSLIAFTGSHGTGKSTAASVMYRDLKYKYPKKSIHVLFDQEVFCPYPINKETTPESQLWIFTNQIRQELSLLSRFDLVVTDRTIVDVIAYTSSAGFDSLTMAMLSIAENHMSIYRKIYFRKIINNDFCYADGIREAKDQTFRDEIEELMLVYFDELLHGKYITGEFKYV
ncbi:MAG: AAA family ATPase [Deltaproteobacteria bacterium]|nr:AAA family ATPase [Deltaproteobacteria bacterium]